MQNLKKAEELLEAVSKIKPRDDIGTGGDNCRFGYLNKDGKAPWIETHDNFYGVDKNISHYLVRRPCHGWMKSFIDADIIYSQWVASPRLTEKENQIYRSWLETISPWSGILSRYKDSIKITEHGYIFFDDIPSNLLLNFLVASRMPKEWPTLIKDWFWLTDQDIDPALAFFFVTVFDTEHYSGNRKYIGSNQNMKLDLATESKYDWPLDVTLVSEQYLKNFIDGAWSNLNKNYFVNTYYDNPNPVNSIWGKHDTPRYTEELQKRYLKKYGKLDTVTSNLNGRKTDKWSVTVAEAVEMIKDEQKRMKI